MAEALDIAGSAVGIISLAVQLGDGILKLKSFWNAVKDAPEDILYILDELDITHVLLTEIENSPGSQTISPAAARSLRLCQKGVDILKNAIKELEDEMRLRKKWGGVKMVMKKELLEKMEKRLGRANSLMMLAHRNYIASLNKSRHDEQVKLATQQFSEMTSINTKSLLITSSANTASGSRSTRALSKYQKILNAKLRLPFFSGVWELCAYQQSISGWNFILRTYNVVDECAPIMKLARDGDVAGMQQLIQTRQASPFDVDKNGRNLLHAGASRKKYNVCRFLVDQDVDINMEDSFGWPAWSWFIGFLCPVEDDFAMIQCLVLKTDHDVINDLPVFLNHAYQITPKTFKWLIRSTENPIHERNHRERALLVLAISKCRLRHMKELVWLTLDNMDLETCVQNLKQAEFFTFLKRIIYCLGFIIARNRGSGGNMSLMAPFGDCLKGHLNLIHELFLVGSKYHNLKVTYKGCHRSFLCILLMGFFEGILGVMRDKEIRGFERLEQIEQIVINLAEIWLDQIILAGIDLIEYGQWEKKMLDDDQFCGFVPVIRTSSPYMRNFHVVSLLSFTCGPIKSDWQFWFTIEPECIHDGCIEEF